MRTTGATVAFAVLLVVAAVGVVSADSGSFAQGQETTVENADLDLREANVVGVEFERGADGDDGGPYDFSVTLYHDDDGEPGYANWWQVETLNGTELGRRDLLHAHGTQPFTRSERIEVPANVSLVVVRGHDQTHGYGGQAMVVDLRTNSTEAIRQGPERQNFSECTVIQGEVSNETTTAGTPTVTRTPTATTPTAATTATAETDLVDCPWEETENRTTA